MIRRATSPTYLPSASAKSWTFPTRLCTLENFALCSRLINPSPGGTLVTRQPSTALVAICLTFSALISASALAAPPSPTVEWVRQFGTADYENSANVSADILGNVFVAGQTYGSFSGGPATTSTAFLRKYYSGGVPSWTRQ